MDEWETSQAFDDAESEQYNHFKSAYQKLVDNQQTNNKREVHENKTTLLKNQKSKQTNGTINSMDISQKINKTTEIVHLNDCPMSEIIIWFENFGCHRRKASSKFILYFNSKKYLQS